MNSEINYEVAMKTRIFLLALGSFMLRTAYGSEPGPDWFEADKTAATLLVAERRDIADLVAEVVCAWVRFVKPGKS